MLNEKYCFCWSFLDNAKFKYYKPPAVKFLLILFGKWIKNFNIKSLRNSALAAVMFLLILFRYSMFVTIGFFDKRRMKISAATLLWIHFGKWFSGHKLLTFSIDSFWSTLVLKKSNRNRGGTLFIVIVIDVICNHMGFENKWASI